MHRITPRRGLALTCVALVAALAAGTFAAVHGQSGRAATPTHALRLVTSKLSCGDTVTTSVVLSNDLSCPDNALTVTGNHITLNLNGHTIDGQGPGTGITVSGSAVTLENGRISDFQGGLSLTGPGGHALNLHVIHNDYGISTFADGAVISGNFVALNGTVGIAVDSGQQSQVLNNWVRANGVGIEVGAVADAPGTLISGNRVLSNNHSGIATFDMAVGTGIVITQNTADSNGENGIVSGNGATLSRNVASSNTLRGILANAEDTDGGTNHAVGNGTLHQCENVVCS